MLTDRVWEAIAKAFASQMKSAFTAPSFVKEIFTMGYPKLYSMLENLLEKISRDTDVKGVLPAINSAGKEQIVSAIEIFQSAFLGHCLSRLSDLVNNVFPMSSRGSVPSREQISRIISRIQEEIEAVQVDARLTLLVLREIGKVLLLFAERAEYQVNRKDLVVFKVSFAVYKMLYELYLLVGKCSTTSQFVVFQEGYPINCQSFILLLIKENSMKGKEWIHSRREFMLSY
jgi:hypothetical protein